MSLSSEQIRTLLASGITGEQMAVVAEMIEEVNLKIENAKEKAREKQRRYRDALRNGDATVTGQLPLSDGTVTNKEKENTPPKEKSPHTPRKQITPTKEKEPTPKTRAREILVLPDWIPKRAWDDYLEMRQKMKPQMTERAKELAWQKLQELAKGGSPPEKVLEQSVREGWKGLFQLKDEGNAGNNGNFRAYAGNSMGTSATSGKVGSAVRKGKWESEAERLAAKYDAEEAASREEGFDVGAGQSLRLAETVRQDGGRA